MRNKLTAEERAAHHRESNLKWDKANPEKRREINQKSHHKWSSKNPESCSYSSRKWEREHRQEHNAECKAQKKIPLSDSCELCGARAQHRHHPDYSKPLLVMHLCARCHRKIHTREHGQGGTDGK